MGIEVSCGWRWHQLALAGADTETSGGRRPMVPHAGEAMIGRVISRFTQGSL